MTSDLIKPKLDPAINSLKKIFLERNPNKPAPKSICDLKGTIRKRESLGATRYFSIPDEQVHFMNLPFYETGTIAKKPISNDDVELTIAIFEKI